MKITEAAIDRPITTVMFFLIVIVMSVVALIKLPIDLMPDVSFPSLSVTVNYPGAAPEEVETLIARRIEEAMGSVDGIKRMDTDCQEERAVVRLRFEWGADLREVSNDVRSRLDRIRGAMPEEAEPPVLYKYDFNASPIMHLAVAGDMDAARLRHTAEYDLKPRLERVKGIASVDVSGGLRREIQVNLIQESLDALNIRPRDVVNRIRAENLNLPAGEVGEGDLDLLVRTYGQFTSPKDLEEVIVAVRNDTPIYLRSIAEINDGFQELRAAARVEGQDVVILSVVKESTANTVQVAEDIRDEIEQIQIDMNYLTLTNLYDSSRYIEDAISGVKSAATYGGILAIIVLLVFLRNIRSTLIIASAIPVSVMAAFSLIYFAGFTLNIVSFGGLALGVGLLVDNSIVVLENIFRHRESGESRRNSAVNGTGEVSMAILASTLTTIVVFVPLLFLSGPAKIMFGQMAYIVAFSLICSLVVSLTLIPMLARKFLRVESLEVTPNESLHHKFIRLTEGILLGIEAGYRKLLHVALAHRTLVLFSCTAIFVMALPFLRTVPFEYMPATDEGEVRVYGEMAPGTRLEAVDAGFREIERIVREKAGDEIKVVQTEFGLTQWWRSGGANGGNVTLRLKDRDERKHSSMEIANLLRKELNDIPGMKIRTRASGGLFIFRILGRQGERLSVDVRGHDRDTAVRLAEQIKKKIEAIPGISDARIEDIEPRPDVGLLIDRRRAAEAGLTVSEIAQAVRTKFGGDIATRYREMGDEFDVRVRLRDEDRSSMANLDTLWLVTPTGNRVPASNFVRQRRGMGPQEIERKDQERSLSVQANLMPGATLGNVMQEVQRDMREINMPEGFALVYGGEYEDQQDAYRQLGLGLLLALLLVYMVMASQFESLVHPLIIMFSIPFAFIGVIATLLLTNTTLNVQSILGTTMLAGIAVNNAIVLVDYINMLRRKRGMSLREAVEEGGRRRLRPIIMTSLTTMLALSPMAIGLGSGSELQAPMARVVIGGLFTSTLITLLFIPTLYTSVEEFKERFRSKKPAQSPSADLLAADSITTAK
jgi:HAE1 family hydrophobic/amphiphilic exporter-1